MRRRRHHDPLRRHMHAPHGMVAHSKQWTFRIYYCQSTSYAVLVGGANGDGAWRGLVTIVESIDPRPYILQPAVYGRLIYTVIYMSDRLLSQENANPYLTPPT